MAEKIPDCPEFGGSYIGAKTPDLRCFRSGLDDGALPQWWNSSARNPDKNNRSIGWRTLMN